MLNNAVMDNHMLLMTLAIVAGLFGGLFGASVGNIENGGSLRPEELAFPLKPKETAIRKHSITSPHIVGGKEAIPHSLPHQVILLKKNKFGAGYDLVCGGSLISDSWVVTAAHCVDEYKLGLTAGTGVHDRSDLSAKNVQLVQVSGIILHPKWEYRIGPVNDIALLKLATKVRLDGTFAKSIRLPKLSQKNESFKGSNVIISGWGRTGTDPNSRRPPNKLRVAQSEVIGNLHCKLRYLFFLVRDTNVCTSTRNKTDTCQGDSGGPMIVIEDDDGEATLIGITSFGIGCNWIFPGVYTRVTSYLDWIHDNTDIAPRI